MDRNKLFFWGAGVIFILVFASVFLATTNQSDNILDITNTETFEVQFDETEDHSECDAVESIDACTPEELALLGITSTEEYTETFSKYWTTYQDPGYGVQFAIPCFWNVDFPADYHLGNGSISHPIRNYTDEYIRTFPRSEGVFDNGGIKIDMNYMMGIDWGLKSGASPEEFANALFGSDDDSEITDIQNLTINGQVLVHVLIKNLYGDSDFYVFTINPDLFLMFAVINDSANNEDVLAILNSIVIDQNELIELPIKRPGIPPQGLIAPCMGINEIAFDPEAPTLDCQYISFSSLEALENGLINSFENANTGSIIYEYTNENINIAKWQSDGREINRTDFFTSLANEYYYFQVKSVFGFGESQISFTNDQDKFPLLAGDSAEAMIKSDESIEDVLYSDGWGIFGNSGALLFIAKDECGEYYWQGLIYSEENFIN